MFTFQRSAKFFSELPSSFTQSSLNAYELPQEKKALRFYFCSLGFSLDIFSPGDAASYPEFEEGVVRNGSVLAGRTPVSVKVLSPCSFPKGQKKSERDGLGKDGD